MPFITIKTIQAVIVALLFAVSVVACALPIQVPTEAELAEFRQGEKVVVLLRFVVKEPDGTLIKPFDNLGYEGNLRLVLGNFESGGIPKYPLLPQALSAKSRDEGWIYFLLTPGTYYIAVRPARTVDAFTDMEMLKLAPRWFIDIPDEGAIFYGGSLYFEGEKRWLLDGHDMIGRLYPESSQIYNEEEKARILALEHLGDHGPFKTGLMERHKTDTYFLRTPSSK